MDSFPACYWSWLVHTAKNCVPFKWAKVSVCLKMGSHKQYYTNTSNLFKTLVYVHRTANTYGQTFKLGIHLTKATQACQKLGFLKAIYSVGLWPPGHSQISWHQITYLASRPTPKPLDPWFSWGYSHHQQSLARCRRKASDHWHKLTRVGKVIQA